mmetsp:Transcript_39368/g.111349  ORF Transcript_39368/g.111349 Transcript_39368/m.111349 type:complete len:239 (+) Transcript_39368:361-1077(+)
MPCVAEIYHALALLPRERQPVDADLRRLEHFGLHVVKDVVLHTLRELWVRVERLHLPARVVNRGEERIVAKGCAAIDEDGPGAFRIRLEDVLYEPLLGLLPHPAFEPRLLAQLRCLVQYVRPKRESRGVFHERGGVHGQRRRGDVGRQGALHAYPRRCRGVVRPRRRRSVRPRRRRGFAGGRAAGRRPFRLVQRTRRPQVQRHGAPEQHRHARQGGDHGHCSRGGAARIQHTKQFSKA